MNKKVSIIILTTISFLAQAKTSSGDPLSELVSKIQTGNITTKEKQEMFHILKKDIKKTSDAADQIELSFKIRKDELHNKKIWEKIIKATIDIADKSNLANDLDDKEIDNLFSELFTFITKCRNYSAKDDNIHGQLSIQIGSPQNYARLQYDN